MTINQRNFGAFTPFTSCPLTPTLAHGLLGNILHRFLKKCPATKKKGKRKTSPHDVDRDETTVDHTGALFE
jgi:hypothetical protein